MLLFFTSTEIYVLKCDWVFAASPAGQRAAAEAGGRVAAAGHGAAPEKERQEADSGTGHHNT